MWEAWAPCLQVEHQHEISRKCTVRALHISPMTALNTVLLYKLLHFRIANSMAVRWCMTDAKNGTPETAATKHWQLQCLESASLWFRNPTRAIDEMYGADVDRVLLLISNLFRVPCHFWLNKPCLCAQIERESGKSASDIKHTTEDSGRSV